MNLRTLYLVALVIFCISVPAALEIDKIVLLVRGHGREIAFMSEAETRYALIQRFYAAFREESPTIACATRLIVLSWVAMLVFSIVTIRRKIRVPFKLDFVAAAACVLLLAFTLFSLIVFRDGLPAPF